MLIKIYSPFASSWLTDKEAYAEHVKDMNPPSLQPSDNRVVMILINPFSTPHLLIPVLCKCH